MKTVIKRTLPLNLNCYDLFKYEYSGEIKDENGCLKYAIENGEVIIENIKVLKQRIGTGKKLINKVKEIAIENNLPISFYAYPQDETITDDELQKFFTSQGFDLHPDDVDGRLYLNKIF